jgi:hypothetical protein
MTSASIPARHGPGLRTATPGPDILLRHGRDGFEAARRAWNLSVDQRPSAIGLPRSADDVAALVRFARQRGLRVAVQATGHGAATLGALEGALLIRTSRMREVRIDADARLARVEAGARWGDVALPAQRSGLSSLAGSAPSVGVVGYTLGGGLGWLSRRYGLAANAVRRAEVITADARRLDVDASREPGLFWALRGGGGSFAIVTALEFELHPLTEAYAGSMIWPLERAGEILRAWSDWLRQVPEAVTSVARLLPAPNLPEVEPRLRGRRLVVVQAAFLGSAREGERLLAPLRVHDPEIDTFSMLSASDLDRLHMDPPDPVTALGDGMLLSELPDAAIENLLDVAGPAVRSSPLCVDLRQLGGALRRGATMGGAVNRLPAEFALFAVALATGGDAWVRARRDLDALDGSLGRWRASQRYANFAERPRDGDELFGAAVHARLRELKSLYDPAEVIQSSHPVSPGHAEGLTPRRTAHGRGSPSAFRDSIHCLDQHRNPHLHPEDG